MFCGGVLYKIEGVVPPAGNVKIFLRGEGSSIVDDSGHTIALEGGTDVPAISTTQVKYGTSSIYFPSGSNMYFADSPDWTIGGNDYTIDFWIYSEASADSCIFYQGDMYGTPSEIANIIFIVEGGKILWMPDYQNYSDNLQLKSTTLMSTSWNHVAVVRDGNNFMLFINGILEASATKVVTIIDSAQPAHMGSMGSGGWPDGFYLDNFRFTMNEPLWTNTFTPPAEGDY